MLAVPTSPAGPLGRHGAIRPERPASGPPAPSRGPPRHRDDDPHPAGSPWPPLTLPDRQAGFLVHQLVAAQPEPGPSPLAGGWVRRAYGGDVVRHLGYGGPLAPVDLRV